MAAQFVSDRVNDSFNKILALLLLAVWNAVLDMAVAILIQKADAASAMIRESKTLSKMQAIGHGFARHGKREKDAVFSFGARGSHKCAAKVLAEIGACGAFLGKLIGTMMLTLSFVGVDVTSNLVIFGMSIFASGLFATSNISGAIANLMPLSLSNPFFVGEIISIAPAGGPPADGPKTSLVGFVEALTWTHVVIRDFKRKQVYIPHSNFATLVIYNWTRRPTKLCYWNLTASTQVQHAGEKMCRLAEFARKWIKAHVDINHQGTGMIVCLPSLRREQEQFLNLMRALLCMHYVTVGCSPVFSMERILI